MKEVKIGAKYKHYKGNLYEIIAIARDSDDPQKELVVYRGLYDSPEFGKNPIWVRPKEDFLAKVIKDGKEIDRFSKIDK